MKLLAGHLLEHLQNKSFALLLPDQGFELIERKDKRRPKILGNLVQEIEGAKKYIFDSGSDQTEKSLASVRNTAIAMMEFDLFHLPQQSVWVEDPFEAKSETNRYFLLMQENKKDREIKVNFFASFEEVRQLVGTPYVVVPFPFYKNLNEATDTWGWSPGFQPDHSSPVWNVFIKPYTEAMYAATKFLVTLAITNHVQEQVEGKPFKARIPQQFREYPHTVVRYAARATPGTPGEPGAPTGRKRAYELVDGYVWGKHTRPKDQQRFIWPYFRGTQEVGIIEKGHTVIRTRTASER